MVLIGATPPEPQGSPEPQDVVRVESHGGGADRHLSHVRLEE
jgi:hypothetical protein